MSQHPVCSLGFLVVPHPVPGHGDCPGEDEGAPEHEGSAHPVQEGEGVAKINDGEHEGEELAESEHESHGQWRHLGCQGEDWTDAYVPL